MLTTLLGSRAIGIGLVLLVVGGSPVAWAQLSGDQATALADTEQSNLPPDTIGGVLGFGGIGDDYYLSLGLRLTLERDNWGLGLQLPLRLRIIDRGEDNTGDYAGLLRREDWDQFQDFLRVLRFVYVGQRDKKGPYYVRVGELAGLTVGYGTIMHRYYNGLDASRWHTGVNAVVNIGPYGGEAMIGDLVDPYLVGFRFTARPAEIVLGEGWWEMFIAGLSLMSDTRAPFQLQTTLADPAQPMGSEVVVADDDGVPNVTRERALVILGVDVGVELLETEFLSITPYTAVNKMNVVDNGWGWHLGVLWALRAPLLIDTFEVSLRTEYQRVSSDYRGPYFNTVYEIERYQQLASAGGSTRPKLRALCGTALDCSAGTPGGKNGVFLELRAGLPNWIYVGGEYLNYDSVEDDGTLRLSLEVPALEFVEFSAFYYRINVAGASDLFAIDDRSAIVAQAVVPLSLIFSAQVRWWRIWQPGPAGYESVDDWSVGLGFSIPL